MTELPFGITLHNEHSGQEDGRQVILDYKSGKRKPSTRELGLDLQFTIYAYAAREVFGQ